MGTTTTTAQARGLRVSDLAEANGVAPDTVRYYERVGLLPPPRRTPGGYRAYDTDAVDRLRFIQGGQRLGLRLRDIADLLAVRDTDVRPCEPAEQLLRRRLTELDAQTAPLAALRAESARRRHDRRSPYAHTCRGCVTIIHKGQRTTNEAHGRVKGPSQDASQTTASG